MTKHKTIKDLNFDTLEQTIAKYSKFGWEVCGLSQDNLNNYTVIFKYRENERVGVRDYVYYYHNLSSSSSMDNKNIKYEFPTSKSYFYKGEYVLN